MDQPHIWVMEIAVISKVQQLFDALRAQRAQENQ